MTPRYVTIDWRANILEVTYLRDRYDRPTLDPVLAERCIIRLPNGSMVAATTDEAPVYTVH